MPGCLVVKFPGETGSDVIPTYWCSAMVVGGRFDTLFSLFFSSVIF